jgi:hypothetical protein
MPSNVVTSLRRTQMRRVLACLPLLLDVQEGFHELS